MYVRADPADAGTPGLLGAVGDIAGGPVIFLMLSELAAIANEFHRTSWVLR